MPTKATKKEDLKAEKLPKVLPKADVIVEKQPKLLPKANLKAEKLPKLLPTVTKQQEPVTGANRKQNEVLKPPKPTSPVGKAKPTSPAGKAKSTSPAGRKVEVCIQEEIIPVIIPVIIVPEVSISIAMPEVDSIEISEVDEIKTDVLSGAIDTNIETAVVIKEQEPSTSQQAPKILNGNICLVYEQYNEMFEIVEGSTTHANIDDVYCLSFVMPDCAITLSVHSPTEMRTLEIDGESNFHLFVPENPMGVYQTLEADKTYYVYVKQKAEQLKMDQERMKVIAAGMNGATIKEDPENRISRDDGRVVESCSCVYGNPCVDEYGCKDWDNRAKVATANGWKGF
mmetsp:Transcript_9615/g.9418  ORF Transcript_9615/g.9418 Transcript_9615/m.9418 type:complete len:341 (+) Transcript_9615:200-1222(+)|eukprot:CAMPEP_0119035660 /NCGR_PEP_ID=MMETSP1177-20130426/2828_1 /TAXON_ID=2985 /ORGANISM="Ochromonas sp, Strain CCMP1899" /LENGTH=340 /DNA_ID=CAMNT_0006994267 /DNA_START=162 /DNA_END=1184 /DNA_ORIENTATION=-